jgi:hypothetical protein
VEAGHDTQIHSIIGGEAYEAPFAFAGKADKVTWNLSR